MGDTSMNLVFRMLGGILLVLAGGGGGFAVYAHQYAAWRTLHTLEALFRYLQGLLSYQALTGEEMLRRAALYPEFALLFGEKCTLLDELPLPNSVPAEIRMEIRSGLAQLAMEPRQNACRTLQRLAELSADTASQRKKEVQMARRMWPRLGACMGLLAAILLC